MKLAVFTNQFPSKVSTFFARDIRGLIESGIEVEIFPIYDLNPTLWKYVPDILDARILPRDRVHHLPWLDSALSVRPVPLRQCGSFLADYLRVSRSAIRHGAAPWLKSSYVFPKAWAWARQFAGQFDHVLAYWGNYAGTCAYLFHKLAGGQVPFSIFLHAGTDLYRTPVFLKEKLLYADRIITCNEFNRQFIVEHFSEIAERISDRIVVSYHGMDLGDLPFEVTREKSNTVVGVGHLAAKKGFTYLVHAVHVLKSSGREVFCELVGDGEQERELKELVRRLGLEDQIKFHGWLPFDETKEKIRRATLLTHPSTELGDGLPNVIKEAMALGTPVVASRIAGIPEGLNFGQCGVLVPPKDANALATEIGRLLDDAALRQGLAKAARQFAERKFDMWQNGRRLADLLRSTRRLPETEAIPSSDPATRRLQPIESAALVAREMCSHCQANPAAALVRSEAPRQSKRGLNFRIGNEFVP